MSTIIFTHFGLSDYLPYTLQCAKVSNPNARLILLGDEKNKSVALKNQWEHFHFDTFRSIYHPRFNSKFRHIQGSQHHHLRNGKDWLRYVFERWLFIEALIRQEQIKNFWHFDSDTMILQDLSSHELNLQNIDFTSQCSDHCLNGFMKSEVIPEYCEHICELFEDDAFLKKQQDEFDNINPTYAFTEMRAFHSYMKKSNRPHLHLMKYSEAQIFEDCLCEEHSFEFSTLKSQHVVKNIFAENGHFFCYRNKRKVELITLNLSWLPDYVFKWTLNSLRDQRNQFLQDAPVPLKDLLKGILKKIKRLIQ